MKTKSILFALIALLAMGSLCQADIKKAMEATCMIYKVTETEVEGKKTIALRCGTGVVFRETEEKLYILTAGHVLHKQLSVFCYFYNSGDMSNPIPAKVVLEKFKPSTPEDVGVVTIDKKSFGKYPIPKPIPLAEKDVEIKVGQRISSCGCPSGLRWPNAWLGSVKYVSPWYFQFIPKPLPGRSGSGIFDDNGDSIIGILIMYTDTRGTATSIRSIHKFLEGLKIEEPKKEEVKKDEKKQK
jgi:hypothetical protein